jgi:predicted phosphoribosyltransferase
MHFPAHLLAGGRQDPRLPLADRREAGRLLASELADLRDAPGLLVLALPRGGVPVGYEIAQALGAPLDVLVVRKIGMPGHPEYAIGALASGPDGGLQVLDRRPGDARQREAVQAVIREERAELQRRERAYRGQRPPPEIQGHAVILVDDGLATGATMEAAARAVRLLRPGQLVVAAPVASSPAARRLAPWVDRLAFIAVPEPFDAVSLWYRDFAQTQDDEVQRLLAATAHLELHH